MNKSPASPCRESWRIDLRQPALAIYLPFIDGGKLGKTGEGKGRGRVTRGRAHA